MEGPAISVSDVWKSFTVKRGGIIRKRRERIVALRGLSFNVDWGSLYCLLGPNGAGKTTAVRIITTLLLPDKGRVVVNGLDCLREPEKVRGSLGVMLSVEKGFFWKLTGRENLKYFALLYGLDPSRVDDRVEYLLDVTGLSSLGGGDKRFENMSLGMRARLGIARALLRDPPILVLDEPTLGLDPVSARVIRELLRREVEKGKAVLVTTHNMYEAEMICDKVGIIVSGRIVVEGSVTELKRKVSDKIPLTIILRGDEEKIRRIAGEYNGLVDRIRHGFRIRLLVDPGKEYDVMEKLLGRSRGIGASVVEARVEQPSLEDVFIKVVGGEKWV